MRLLCTVHCGGRKRILGRAGHMREANASLKSSRFLDLGHRVFELFSVMQVLPMT